MIDVLFSLLVFAVVVYVVYLLLDLIMSKIPGPAVLKVIVYLLVGLFFLWILLSYLGFIPDSTGHFHMVRA